MSTGIPFSLVVHKSQSFSFYFSASYLRDESVDEDKSGRQWWYQKCSELGFFQVAPPEYSVRSPSVNIAYHHNLCRTVFGIENLWPDSGAVNMYYGGAKLDVILSFIYYK